MSERGNERAVDSGWEVAIRTLEDEARRVFVARDMARLDRLWSPHYTVNSPVNVVTGKTKVLELLQSGRIAHVSYEGEIEHVSRHGDTVVVMGRETVVNEPGGAPVERRYTNVWRLEGGEWKGIARHANVATRSPGPPG